VITSWLNGDKSPYRGKVFTCEFNSRNLSQGNLLLANEEVIIYLNYLELKDRRQREKEIDAFVIGDKRGNSNIKRSTSTNICDGRVLLNCVPDPKNT
jgi:hypothetical protein